MKLIKELSEDIEYLKENTDSGKNYFIKGIIMQGDIKNRNGRVYPSEVLMNEMKRYNERYISKKRAFGELGHPDGPTVNLDRVSHMFTELKQEGSNIIGKAKIMETPMGKIVKSLIDEEACIGISSRGMGSLKENSKGIMEVQNDFMLATAGDIVADPSGPDCYVQGVMENVEWIFDEKNGWQAQEIAEQHQEEIRKDYKSLDESRVFDMFHQFLMSLK